MSLLSSIDHLCCNFRGLGGAPTGQGRRVARDRIFRSGEHGKLSQNDAAQLLAYDFELIVDLRYPDERAKIAPIWPAAWSKRLLAHDHETGKTAPHIAILSAAVDGAEAVHRAYKVFYQTIVFDPVYRPLFANTLYQLAETKGRTLIHCAGGKDRTGVLVALLYEALGVGRTTIVADYMLTENAPELLSRQADLAEMLSGEGIADAGAVAKALVGVRPDYISAMFESVEQKCGSVADYLADGGVDSAVLTRLRQRLIER